MAANCANSQPDGPVSAIIAAAGSANRMRGTDKLLLSIGGMTVLERTVSAFARCADIDEIVIASSPERLEAAREIASRYPAVKAVVPGGATRSESVRNAVAACSGTAAFIAIHDGARPFVSGELIARVIREAREWGAAAPGLAVTDTLKRVADGAVAATVDREDLVAVETPQVFEADLYRRAIALSPEATDDCAIVERAGHAVRIVPGQRTNIKITTPDDLPFARYLAGEETMDIRTGQGYDVHRLTDGRPLILGGVEVPFEKGLDGHSDADVLTHAVIDALLGAAALGDIGQHFPPSDNAYRGIRSTVLLERTASLLREGRWRVLSVDATVICERPKLAPYIGQMREALAASLALETGRVSVKATTEEGLGFTGTGQGIAAQAAAMIARQTGETI